MEFLVIIAVPVLAIMIPPLLCAWVVFSALTEDDDDGHV
jgi:hypothetical protein